MRQQAKVWVIEKKKRVEYLDKINDFLQLLFPERREVRFN
jgi:hypothetical protein